MMTVVFLFELFASQNRLFSVDDDDVVPTVSVRGKIYFVFAAQDRGGDGRSAAERFVSSVKNLPFTGNLAGFRHGGRHVFSLL